MTQTIAARPGYIEDMTDEAVQRFYDFNTEQMVKYVGQRDEWQAALPKSRGNRRKQIVAEIERCRRILWDLENLGNKYGSELNRRGLLG